MSSLQLNSILVCVTHFLIHSSVPGQLCCFYFLPIVKLVAIKISEHVSVEEDIEFLANRQRSSTTVSYCSFIFVVC